MISRRQSILTCLALVAAMSFATGCAAPWKKKEGQSLKVLSMSSSWPWADDETLPRTPARFVDSWTDTVLHQAGKKAQRGFGGRMIFYAKEGEKPILVDGQLVVYAFDESNRLPTDQKPTRRYVFPAEQVAIHMSKSEIGPSYSFWLPWDEEGGPQTEVSLIARFQPKDGPVVVGEQTKHLLPGAQTPPDVAAAGQPPRLPDGVPYRPARITLAEAKEPINGPSSPVQQASYDSQAPELPASQRRMTTTSISLPDRLGRSIAPATAPPATPPAATSPSSAIPSANGHYGQSMVPPTASKSAFTQNAPPEFQRTPLQAAYKPLPQSPFAGQPMFGTPPQAAPGTTASWPPAGAQPLGPQLPVGTNESQWSTTVSYSPPVEAAAAPAPATPTR
jgi:hypothetical protein